MAIPPFCWPPPFRTSAGLTSELLGDALPDRFATTRVEQASRVRDALGHRAQRADAVEAAAADDDEVGQLGRPRERVGWRLGPVVVLTVGDRRRRPLVRALAAPGDNRVKFGTEALGRSGGCVGRRGLIEPSTPTTIRRGNSGRPVA